MRVTMKDHVPAELSKDIIISTLFKAHGETNFDPTNANHFGIVQGTFFVAGGEVDFELWSEV